MKRFALGTIGIALLALAGCQQPQTRVEAAGPEAAGGGAGAPAASVPAPPPEIAIPQGTALRVRLAQTVDTQRNRPGDRFQATLDVPLLSGNRVIVPQGTSFYGQVVQAKPSGRFKGRAVLALRLDSFELNGQSYTIRSATPTRVSKGHLKHDTVWIGGGAAGGAGIGALAGGPMGALIGAGAGAGAGLTGGLITGKKHVRLPVETRLTFTLSSEIRVRG
jgi:hypothetical protein